EEAIVAAPIERDVVVIFVALATVIAFVEEDPRFVVPRPAAVPGSVGPRLTRLATEVRVRDDGVEAARKTLRDAHVRTLGVFSRAFEAKEITAHRELRRRHQHRRHSESCVVCAMERTDLVRERRVVTAGGDGEARRARVQLVGMMMERLDVLPM